MPDPHNLMKGSGHTEALQQVSVHIIHSFKHQSLVWNFHLSQFGFVLQISLVFGPLAMLSTIVTLLTHYWIAFLPPQGIRGTREVSTKAIMVCRVGILRQGTPTLATPLMDVGTLPQGPPITRAATRGHTSNQGGTSALHTHRDNQGSSRTSTQGWVISPLSFSFLSSLQS